MKMHTRWLVACVALIALAVPLRVSAQTTIDQPTLSALVNPGDTSIKLSSVTCTNCTFGPGTKIYVDLEEMEVAGTYVTGTTVPVIRTMQAAHANAAVASIGPAPRFHLSDPPIGPCNKTLQSNGFYPWINLKTGAEWFCDNGSTTVYASAWRVVYPYLLGTVAASR